MENKQIIIPFLIPHSKGLPDLDSIFRLRQHYSDLYANSQVNFEVTILVDKEQTKLIFKIEKACF